QVYVRNKAAACEKAGINSEIIRLPEDASEDRLLDTVKALNQNPDVHGILVQLPLPGHMNSANVIATIAPEKDVDGFHINNVERLMTGSPLFKSCRLYGITPLRASENVNVGGAEAVIVGARNTAGEPIAMLMLAEGVTAPLCI